MNSKFFHSMLIPPMIRFSFLLICFVFLVIPVFSQTTGQQLPDSTTPELESDQQEDLTPIDQLIFPQRAPGLIYLEAENAVATNFTTQPTLDYSSSGQRMIQLNRSTPLFNGAPFTTDFVFVVETAGTYQLWYAGTPPGPRDPLVPSYTSPFSYTINDGPVVPVFREDSQVVESITPILYWITFGEVDLEPGVHTLRILVDERRGFDNRFFFYLDSLFLLDRNAASPDPTTLSHSFPKDLDDRSIDNPFRTINDYVFLIAQEPQNISRFINLSTVYSLVGDYQSSLRYLIRAQLIEPQNPQLMLLIAKNRLWRGDAREGLDSYIQYLDQNPQDLNGWAEAAKLAAWTGQYDRSLELYQRALETFPGNLTLQANKSLTYLWANRGTEGLRAIQQANELALESPDRVVELAETFNANGYPDYAQQTLELGLRAYPNYVLLHTQLSNLLLSQGQSQAAEEVLQNLVVRSGNDPGLTRYLDTFRQRQQLSNSLIQRYQQELAQDPDNLDLRDALAQALFWQGRREEAIDELKNILINQYYRSLMPMITEYESLITSGSQAAQLGFQVSSILDLIPPLTSSLQNQSTQLTNAERTRLATQTSLTSALERMANLEGDRLIQQQERVRNLELQLADHGTLVSQAMIQLTQLITQADQVFLHLDRLRTARDELPQIQPQFTDELEGIQNQLAQVQVQKNWSYDSRVYIADLSSQALQGNPLANGALAFLYLGLGQLDQANAALERARTRSSERTESLAELQAVLIRWTQKETQESTNEPSDDSNGSSSTSSVESPNNQTMESVDRLINLANELRQRLREAPQSIQQIRQELQSFQAWVLSSLQTLTSFKSYLFEEETVGLRNLIADFLVADGNYAGAIQQFTRVLVMDPQNVAATYQLATVQDRLGNWSSAMRTYERVNEIDRGNMLAIRRFNQLSELHPRVITADFSSFTDTSRSNIQARLGFATDLAYRLDLRVNYQMDANRLHTAFATTNNPGAGNPESTQFHTLKADLGMEIIPEFLTLRPVLGAVLQNRLVEDRFSQLPSPFLPQDVLTSIRIYEILGLGVQISTPQFNGTLEYLFSPVQDSLVGSRFPARSHQANLTLGFTLPFLSSRWVNSLQFTTQARGAIFTTDEVEAATPYSWGINQTIVLTLDLADTPRTILQINGTGGYEDGKGYGIESFFIPDRIFNAKGGVALSSWIPLSETSGSMWGLNLIANGGIVRDFAIPENASPPVAESRILPLVDLGLKTDLTLGNFQFYLGWNGSATFNTSGDNQGKPAYFSSQLNFGVRNSHFRLLFP